MHQIENEEIEEFKKKELSDSNKIDIFGQMGCDNKPPTLVNRYTIPKISEYDELCAKMQKLNYKQRQIVMHVLHYFKTSRTPFNIYLAGSAGVGKSTVIDAVFNVVNHYFSKTPGNNPDTLKVLLCAPSGKAAFLIGGVTLHTAFALPFGQFGGQMPELSADMANSIRVKLFDLQLLIIDEISMVGSRMLNRIDTRLRQIKGVNENFGGVSVLVVGDLKQLRPVLDKYVFENSSTTNLSILVDSPLWSDFYYFELTEIMRQKMN